MRIHIFINCHWNEGISGGDKRVLEIMRRWKDVSNLEMYVYTSESFYHLMQTEGVIEKTKRPVNVAGITYKSNGSIRIVLTDTNVKAGEGIIKTYWKRTFSAIHLVKEYFEEGDYLYSPTDILPDVYPAYVMKKANPSSRWTMTTYHIFEKFYKRPGNIVVNFLSCTQQKMAIKMGLKFADSYPTISPVVLDEFNSKYPKKSDIFFLSGNAVDTEEVEAAALDVEGYDAVFLARLNYSKGIFELPEIWSRVVARKPDAVLALMGKGTPEITEELKTKIKECKIEDHIKLFGYVENEFAHSTMKKSKMFLFTSHEEGWGMALAESLLCDIPVVAYDLPVFRTLFPEGTVLCPLKDVDAMADAVVDLLEDNEKRDRLGKAGHEYVKSHYSWDKTAEDEMKFITGSI